MAVSSIEHNFVVKDKKDAEQLIDALTMQKTAPVAPVKSISGKESITLLMSKWERGK